MAASPGCQIREICKVQSSASEDTWTQGRAGTEKTALGEGVPPCLDDVETYRTIAILFLKHDLHLFFLINTVLEYMYVCKTTMKDFQYKREGNVVLQVI